MIIFLLNEMQKENLQKYDVLVRRGQYPVKEMYVTGKKSIPEVFLRLSKIVIIDGAIKDYEYYIKQFKKHSKSLIVVVNNDIENGGQKDIIHIRQDDEEKFEKLIHYNYERMNRLQIGSCLVWEELIVGYDGSVYGNENRIYLSKQETRFLVELIKSRMGRGQEFKKYEKKNVAELVSRIRKKLEQTQLPCSILCRNNGVYEVWWA